MGQLEDKVIIITGAARGQGEAAARRLVKEGARVVLTDIRDEQGHEVAASLGDRALYAHLDVCSEADWEQVVNVATQKFGGVDVLVNNAGMFFAATIMDTKLEDFRRVNEVNYVGPYLGMRAVIPNMLGRGGGSIINVSSTTGLFVTEGSAAYGASKHALLGLTKCAAIDLARTGIRVNAVCPGSIDTPMLRGAGLVGSGHDVIPAIASKIPMGRVGRSDELAGIIVFLASEDSSYCTGSIFTVDGGTTAGVTIKSLS